MCCCLQCLWAQLGGSPCHPNMGNCPRGSRAQPSSPGTTLLERMGLGNQMLMVRLGLPIRISPSPSLTTSSLCTRDVKRRPGSLNELVMTREMIEETMLGIGISLGVDHHGETSVRETSLSQEKPISYKTLTSPTSNGHSRTSSPNRATQTSPLSSGETSWQIDKLTSQHWLRTNTQGSLPMMRSSILVMTSNSPQRELGNPKLRLLMTCSGILCGQNIQWWFCGPIHIVKMSSPHMDSTSLANSLLASAFPLISNMTKPHENSSMATRTCPLLTLTKLPSSLIRYFYCKNGGGI